MKEKDNGKLNDAIRRLSQLPPAMQDVLMAGFDLGRASQTVDHENDKKE